MSTPFGSIFSFAKNAQQQQAAAEEDDNYGMPAKLGSDKFCAYRSQQAGVSSESRER